MRTVIFHGASFDEYSDWATMNIRTFERLRRIIAETKRTPFQGIGKPESLQHELRGHWSRRIDEKHRLVYRVSDEAITIVSCKYHYSK
jgi:toxin YoeB